MGVDLIATYVFEDADNKDVIRRFFSILSGYGFGSFSVYKYSLEEFQTLTKKGFVNINGKKPSPSESLCKSIKSNDQALELALELAGEVRTFEVNMREEQPHPGLDIDPFHGGRLSFSVTFSYETEKLFMIQLITRPSLYMKSDDTTAFIAIHDELYRFTDLCIRTLSPTKASCGYDFSSYPDFEFYRDPYQFCSSRFEPFNLSNSEKEVEEARKALTRKELIRIIKEHSPRVIEVGLGVGVWKAKPNSREFFKAPKLAGLCPLLYPSYWLRMKMREKGAKLDFGPVENALLFQLHFPHELECEGLLSRRTGEKIEKLIENSEDSLRIPDERYLAQLTKEEKHELGLDLPKPPEWMLKPEGWN